jgi:molybdopterin/thiamine biosynthesis adenylyltransferase
MSRKPNNPADGGLNWYLRPASKVLPAPPFELRGMEGVADRLRDAVVLVLGLGAVGGRLFTTLARAGVGRLIGVDLDRFDAEWSWMTQPCVRGDAGKTKARVLADQANRINPRVAVATAHGFAQSLPLSVLRSADVIVVTGDNIELVIWAASRAQGLGKRLLQGAVHPETSTAFMRGYDLRDPANACPGCGLSQSEWSNQRARFGCDPSVQIAQGRTPTRTMPNVCGFASQLLASEILKALLEKGTPMLAGEELAYCLLSHKMWRTELPANPDCRLPHERWECVGMDRGSATTTLGDLIGSLPAPATGNVEIRGEQSWIGRVDCRRCGEATPVRRFGRTGERIGRCNCGESLFATQPSMHSVLPADDVAAVADRSLKSLGVADGDAIGVFHGDRWHRFFIGTPGDGAGVILGARRGGEPASRAPQSESPKGVVSCSK